MITLYEFQRKGVDEIEAEFAQGTRSILAVSPTGSGKTVILSGVIKRRVAKTQPSLVIAHRREIIEQTARKLRDNGVDSVGVIMSGVEPRPQALVQVASIDTLRARAMNSTSMRMPLASLVGIDEAHHSPATTYQRLIELYPEAQILGATATPCRGDGRGLGNIFAKMIECPQVAELIKLGLLVKSRVYAPIDPDLEGVRTQAGDLRRAAMNWRSLRNLRLGSTRDRKPAKGRGRIQRQVARAFQASGKVVLSSSTIYRWVYPKKTAPGWLERWSVFTVLRVMCHRVGRAKTTGTPWLWKLRQPLDKA